MENVKLNREQLRVVENLTDNILLMAPAGTGKTNTLALRIAGIIKNHRARPERILCLTFTNKACREMKERLAKAVGEEAALVETATIHGFCYRLLKAWAGKGAAGDIPGDFGVADEEDSGEILRQAVPGRTEPLQALLNVVTLIKEARLKYDIFNTDDDRMAYRLTLEKLQQEERQRLLEATAVEANGYKPAAGLADIVPEAGARLVGRYDELLARSKLLDFNDLLIRCRQLLEEQSIARSRWWDFIFIDEAQDLSETEYNLLSRIFGGAKLLLAGDFFQTIYEWRGSNPTAVIEAFRQKFSPVEIVLTENYRSSPLLIKAANDYLREMGGGGSVYPLIPAKAAEDSSDEEPIILHEAESEMAEAGWIYHRLEEMNLPVEEYSRTAILTRSNRQNERMALYLEAEGLRRMPGQAPIPFSLIDEFRFFRHGEIKDALAFMRLAFRRGDDESCRRLAKNYFPNIGEGTLEKLTAPEVAAAGLKLWDFFDDHTLSAGEPYALLTGALTAGNVVVLDTETTGLDAERDEVIQLAAIRIDDRGRTLDKFSRFIRPSAGRLVGDSVNIHGFTDEFLAERGEPAAEVFRDFNKFAAGAVLAGHNIHFDLAILESHFARAGVASAINSAVYDTLDIFRRFYPELKNHKLGTIGEFIGVQHASSHDAFDDICATAECLIFALEKTIKPLARDREIFIQKYRRLTEKTADMIDRLRQTAQSSRPCQLVDYIATEWGLKKRCEALDKNDRRSHHLLNLRHLYLKAQEEDDGSLSPRAAAEAFLRQASLSAGNMEAMLKKRPRIPVITIHQAKGMEFERVFLAGAGNDHFPPYSVKKMREGPEKKRKMGEEARLFYVAITRAKRELAISWPKSSLSGKRVGPSPFVNGILCKYTEIR